MLVSYLFYSVASSHVCGRHRLTVDGGRWFGAGSIGNGDNARCQVIVILCRHHRQTTVPHRQTGDQPKVIRSLRSLTSLWAMVFCATLAHSRWPRKKEMIKMKNEEILNNERMNLFCVHTIKPSFIYCAHLPLALSLHHLLLSSPFLSVVEKPRL